MILGLTSKWSISSMLLTLLMTLPFFALVFKAMDANDDIFIHLLNTVLFTYIANSLLLMLFVAMGSLLLAIPLAWLIARCQFPLKSFFQWALLLPLAMPAYIVAYVYTDLLDYSGGVQGFLRQWFQWQSPSDYYFPEIRSLGGAAIMLSLVLFPYIFLLGKTAFRSQTSSLEDAARMMGNTKWQCFWHLSLPMAKPALAVGVALVLMETAADFATVSYFAVPTLTTAIYDTWLAYGSLASAAKLSVIVLFIIIAMIGVEQFFRRKQQLFQKQSGVVIPHIYVLTGIYKWLACIYCSLLFIFSFLLPFAILVNYAWHYVDVSLYSQFMHYAVNSLLLASMVSVLCAAAALFLLFIKRISPRKIDALPIKIVSFGYALPGTVLAIGVLSPLMFLDFAINDLIIWLGYQPYGLIFSGTLFALIFALCVRFIAISIGSIESSYRHISSNIDLASITMGKSSMTLFSLVHFPLLKKGIFTGLLLVFIESMKELPATLLLRPVGYENLATYVFQFISDEQLEYGALGAIMIIVVGLVPIFVLNKAWERQS